MFIYIYIYIYIYKDKTYFTAYSFHGISYTYYNVSLAVHRYRTRYSEYTYHLLRHNPRCLHVAPVRRYVIVINKTVFSTASAISLIKWPSFCVRYRFLSARRLDARGNGEHGGKTARPRTPRLTVEG